MVIQKIKKRDGSKADFDKEKIVNAILRAAEVGGKETFEVVKILADKVVEVLEGEVLTKEPTVEDVQDIVERVLIQHNHPETAKAFIIYRQKRAELRKQREELIGLYVDKRFSINTLKILKEKFLLEDDKKNIIETPDGMFRRVAKYIAQADAKYSKHAKVSETEEIFYTIMREALFLPNSPTLMNAGTASSLVIASHVLEIQDKTESIYNALKLSAIIHKQGAGTGFSFSRMRPRHAPLESKKGSASGPLSFMQLFDKSTEIIKQGGRKRGANMGVLRVDHPDILSFITAKEDPKAFANFNISIGLTEEFMEAVENKRNYSLIDPTTQKETRKLPANEVFDLIATMAWKNGEPGILFLDRINKKNPTPAIGDIETTSPCAELPMLPNECAPLGAINVVMFVKEESTGKREIDYEHLKTIVHHAVHFLDNLIDVNKYPAPEIEKITKANRKIGLGVMGFADLLFRMRISYSSKQALDLAGQLMKFINVESKKASTALAETRGPFPNFEKSVHSRRKSPLRNATTTAIAPTGTTSLIADCSSGIEPLFALSYTRKLMGGEQLLHVNKYFKEDAMLRGIYTEELMKKVADTNSLAWITEIPSDMKSVYVVSHEVPAKWHVMIQAAFQEHVDNGVSKSVNLKSSARKEDVVKIFKMAYDLGCKGITVYRDKSRNDQILESAY